MTEINTIQDIYDQRAEEELEKLRLLDEKRKKKGKPVTTEREKTQNATKNLFPKDNKAVINTIMPFADIHYLKSKDADTKRSDGMTQRFG